MFLSLTRAQMIVAPRSDGGYQAKNTLVARPKTLSQ
jgi:hypothetical protein